MSNPPVIVAPTPPSVDVGTTAFFTPGSGSQSIVRVRFPTPRQLTLYAYWDPQKNNAQAFAADAIYSSGGLLLNALGTLEIGTQQTITSLNFDIPYQQLIALPVTCDYLQFSARIVAPIFGQLAVPSASPSLQAFESPPNIVIPGGTSYPNVSATYPRGFLAISGMIGEGTLGGRAASAASNIARRTPIQLIPINTGPGTNVRGVPVAWGATHVEIMAAAPVVAASTVASVVVDSVPFPSSYTIPLVLNAGVPFRLPINADSILITNNDVAVHSFEIIQYLGP